MILSVVRIALHTQSDKKRPRWRTIREGMKLTSKARWGDMAFWLGAWSGRRESDGKYVDREKDKWKPNLDPLKDILAFAKATERLEGAVETQRT